MSILTVEKVTHGFGARQILEDASFKLLIGEHVGLVGANGEGKSTFLNIITGQLMPDEGNIEWARHVSVGYLDQHSSLTAGKSIREVLREAFIKMFDLEKEMLTMYDKMGEVEGKELDQLMEDVGEMQNILDHGNFYNLDTRIEEVAAGLGLQSIGLDRDVAELSGGQRSKVLLTKLLLQNPTILILDEPTNYLDEDHIAWLTSSLQNYENSFIIVSHEVEFLNQVINVVYHIESAVLTRYTGDYEKFQEMYQIRRQQHESAYDRQQQEVAKLQDFVDRNKARVSTTGRAKSRQKKLDKMEMIEKHHEKPKPKFGFKEGRTPSREIVVGKNVVLGYDSPLTRPVDFKIERNQKIAICGVNGLGKSTLLKTILGLVPPFAGTIEQGDFLEIGYFEQEAIEDTGRTAHEEIWSEFPGLKNFEVRRALAQCGLTNEHITSLMKVLSGGENAKVRLCKLMLKEANWLILDEPTNHLDVDAKEELKRALTAFKGTILLVSHEPEFYQDWVTETWNVEDWTTKIV